MTFRGLTWDHPRGRDALREAARRVNAGRAEPLVDWAVQPLEGFESAPIAELAAAHDLLVLDHPHIGEAVAEGCLRPLEDLYAPDLIARWRRDSVGPSAASYAWEGRTWALPLDVATQVMARRADLVGDAPRSWDEAVATAGRRPVAQSLAGPHAVLTLMSVAAGRGDEAGGEAFLPDEAFAAALGVMRRLWALRPPGSEGLNPITLLEAVARGELALVPLVFGYVTYAKAITFSDAIGGRGGVLGGTGLAFTARCRPTPDLLGHVASLLAPEAQAGLLPAFGGQPSARAAWTDDAVNAAAGGFYRATLATAEGATLRPRFDGFVAFQAAASARLREALAAGEDEIATLAAIRSLWAAARGRARGPLDDRDAR